MHALIFATHTGFKYYSEQASDGIFCVSELSYTYLEYVVNSIGLLVDLEKVEFTLQIKTPTNVFEVKCLDIFALSEGCYVDFF